MITPQINFGLDWKYNLWGHQTNVYSRIVIVEKIKKNIFISPGVYTIELDVDYIDATMYNVFIDFEQ